MIEERDDNTKSGDNPTKGMEASDHTVIIEVPRELGCYRLTRLLGRGGMGEVWQAFDMHLERDVAIKLMRKELLSNEDATRRFAREARAVARLNHPNIVQVYAFGDEKGLTYFVMELVEGETISQCLKRKCKISLEDALHIMLQAIEGLSYANARGIIHRDIKPSNLMLTDDARVKIADFGLAKMVEHDTQMTAAGTAMGSPNYMSPEQARGEEADHRSDIYALGISLYQILCGELPFTASSPVSVLLKHIQEPLPEPIELKQMSNGAVLDVIKKMTDKKPELRFQTYGELANSLAALQPNLRVKGAHLATASMPVAKTPTPGLSRDEIPPPPPPGETSDPDSLFSRPSAVISPTPSDQKTAVVSSRDTGSQPTAVPANGVFTRRVIAVAGTLAVLLLIGLVAWYMLSREDGQTAEVPGDAGTEVTVNNDDSQAAPGVGNDANPPAASATPIPSPTPAPTASPTAATATPRPQGMQPVNISAIVTPRPTPIPGIPTTITPVPSLTSLAPTFNQLIIGGADNAAGSPVQIYDATGNVIGSLAAGSPAQLIRPATINGNDWFVIRHNGGEAFVKSAEAHFVAPGETAQAHADTATPAAAAPTIYVLGTSGAGPDERVPTYLDSSGRTTYKTFPAGTEVGVIQTGVTMLRVIAPDGKAVFVYKKMAAPK